MPVSTFVPLRLDADRLAFLEAAAAEYASGNRSFVIRRAVDHYAAEVSARPAGLASPSLRKLAATVAESAGLPAGCPRD